MSAPRVRAEGINAWFGDLHALKDVTFDCPAGHITGIIGGTGSGKSTFLRLVNRLAEEREDFRHSGRLLLDDQDIFGLADPVLLRRRVGLVHSRPTLFSGSIWDNVAFGPRIAGLSEAMVAARVQESLQAVDLWDELGGRLDQPPQLDEGGSQRLCTARALALEPQVLMLDEPTRRLDAQATAHFEALLYGLRERVTVLLVTHDSQQAGRLADHTAFFDAGRLVEAGPTEQLFTRPANPATQAYLSHRYT